MKIIAEDECWSQKWSQDGADTESVSVSIRPAVLLCLICSKVPGFWMVEHQLVLDLVCCFY